MVERADELDVVWRALSDPTRRRLLDLIREKPRTVGELSDAFAGEMTRFSVMKHLGVLKEAQLVIDRKEGRQVWNHLNAVPLRMVYERWVSRYESAWAGALLGLKRAAEGTEQRADVEVGRGNDARPSERRVELEIQIDVARSKVFAALSEQMGVWWPLRSGRGDVRLEAQIGGRLMEEWSGGGALLGTVTQLEPGRSIAVLGPMGLDEAALLRLAFVVEGDEQSSLVRLSFHDRAAVTDEAPQRVLAALKDYLETGKRFAA